MMKVVKQENGLYCTKDGGVTIDTDLTLDEANKRAAESDAVDESMNMWIDDFLCNAEFGPYDYIYDKRGK